MSEPQWNERFFRFFGEKLGEARQRQQIEPRDLADRVGMPQEIVEAIEKGSYPIRPHELSILCEHLDVDFEELVQAAINASRVKR